MSKLKELCEHVIKISEQEGFLGDSYKIARAAMIMLEALEHFERKHGDCVLIEELAEQVEKVLNDHTQTRP